MTTVGGNEREPDRILPANRFVLALVWFVRRTSAQGNPYLRCRFVVCSGPFKGSGFFCPWNLDVSNAVCRRRWELLLEAVGHKSELELDSDSEIAKAIKGAPFVATVKVFERGDYRGNDIDRLVYPRQYTPAELKAMAEWRAGWDERSGMYRDPSDPGPSDSDAPRGSTEEAQPQWSPGSRFADDSDEIDGDTIPF